MKQPKKNSINLHRTSRTYTEVKWHRTTRTYTVLLQFVLTKTSKTLFESSGTVVPLSCCRHETGCEHASAIFLSTTGHVLSDIQAFKKKFHNFINNPKSGNRFTKKRGIMGTFAQKTVRKYSRSAK